MMRKYKISIGVLVAVAMIGAGVYFVLNKNNKPARQNVLVKQVEYKDPKTEASVKYPESASVSQISEDDKKANISLRLTEGQGQKPYLITLRSESGLRVVATLTRTEIIDAVMRSSEKALPQRFQGFYKESSKRYEHNGRKAGEIIFTYDSPVPGERIKQRLIILVKDDDMAVYLAMQSKAADFDEQNAKTFNPIAESLNFQ